MDFISILANGLDWLARGITVVAVVGSLAGWLALRSRGRLVQRFFGGRRVTVYLPRRILEGRTAVSEADLVAVEQLTRFLGKYNIELGYRLIGPEDQVPIDEPGTILICGPKSNKHVAKLLNSDRAVSFIQAQDGKYALFDHVDSRRYRSLRDQNGAFSDIGYLARRVPPSQIPALSLLQVFMPKGVPLL